MANTTLKNNNGQVRQLNIGDSYGELSETFNIDLQTSPGKIKLARPLKTTLDSDDLSDKRIEALLSNSNSSNNLRVFAITESDVFQSTAPFTTWANNTLIASGSGAIEDSVIYRDNLCIRRGTDMDAIPLSDLTGSYTIDWWTDRGNSALTSTNTVGHPPAMIYTTHIGVEKIVALDGSSVYSYDGEVDTGTGEYGALLLNTNMIATCFCSSNRYGFIGTYTLNSDEALVYQWDTASDEAYDSYPVGSKAVLSMISLDNAPLILNEKGEFKLFNNAGFTTIAQLPFSFKELASNQYANPNNSNRPVHPKGMKRDGKYVYVYVNFQEEITENLMDASSYNGIWVLNLENFSVHHYASQDNHKRMEQNGSAPILITNSSYSKLFVGGDTVNGVGLFMQDRNDATTNYGHFITSEIESNSVKDTFNSIYPKVLSGQNDSFVVKYKIRGDVNMPVFANSVTWLEPNIFNTTVDLSDVKTRFDNGNLDEVSITYGTGAGKVSQITNIEASELTYSVTLEDNIGVTGETSEVIIEDYQKIKNIEQLEDEVTPVGVKKPSTFVKLKFLLTGKAGYPEFRDVLIHSDNKNSV